MAAAGGTTAITGAAGAGDATAALSIQALRTTAARDPKAAIRETARQFEALFMQQLMKSMRENTMSSGLFENQGSQLGTEMLDTQYANKMSGLKGGLADVIAKQLERQMGITSPAAVNAKAQAVDADTRAVESVRIPSKQAGFVQQHTEAAKTVQAETGIPSAFMLGQAAHESGWGQREIRNADGSSAHNLFGIKAGSGWTGKTASVTTTEYIGGQPRKVTAKFRAYDSYADSFRDYAKLIKDNPRYQQVYQQAAVAPADSAASAAKFAKGLQTAGYATDPAYADKLTRIINTTLRLQRSVS